MILRTGDIFTATTNNYTYRYEFIGFNLDDPTGCRHIALRNLDTDMVIYVEHQWFNTELTGRKIGEIKPVGLPLYEFLKLEVPYRLFEVLEYDEDRIPSGFVEKAIKYIYNYCDFIDADLLDNILMELYEKECAEL